MKISPYSPLVGALALVCAPLTQASDSTRQHDAHEHGHAVLNIAIDGNSLLIELETPAANIVGFEHEPENAEQKAQIEQAEDTLADAAAMFALPAAAGCTLAKADIEAPHEDHGHDKHDDDHKDEHKDEHKHEEEHKDEHKDEHKHADHDDEEVHSEFHAAWTFQCDAIARLDVIDVKLFEHFPGTEEIDANFVGHSGQGSVELSAGSARVKL